MRTLQQVLDESIEYMHRAAKLVEPGGDLLPILGFTGSDGRLNVVPLPLVNKDAEIAFCRRLLREQGATQYATVSSAWQMNFDFKIGDEADRKRAERLVALYEEYGSSHPEILPYRREVCQVTAGDRNGTLTAAFDCHRDAAGRIIRLVRQPGRADALLSGRIVDLLAEARQ